MQPALLTTERPSSMCLPDILKDLRMVDLVDKSFIATLYSTKAGRSGQVGISAQRTEFDFAESGWLQIVGHGLRVRPIDFHFQFVEDQGDRIHYDITCASRVDGYLGKKLGRSSGGYLGLYGKNEITFFWKVQPRAEWYGQQERHFILRDYEGHEIKSYDRNRDGDRYLNAYEGAPLSFAVRIKEVL